MKKIFVNRNSKIAAVIISVVIPVMLICYTIFLTLRPSLNIKSERTFTDTLIANSDIILSLLFLVISSLPFFLVFDKRKSQARDIVPIAIMSAIAIIGRLIFSIIPLPNFKPVTAIVIITGIAFGPEGGFLTGALTGFVSNFIFGQGPWTPWQMFCWGMAGFIAGLFYQFGLFGKVGDNLNEGGGKTPVRLIIFGFLSGILYGWVMNIYYVIGYVDPVNVGSVIAVYISSIFSDVSHGLCTALVLFAAADAWVRKLLRVKRKFALQGEQVRYVMPTSLYDADSGNTDK